MCCKNVAHDSHDLSSEKAVHDISRGLVPLSRNLFRLYLKTRTSMAYCPVRISAISSESALIRFAYFRYERSYWPTERGESRH